MDVTTRAIGFDRYGGTDVFEEKTMNLTLDRSKNVLVKLEYAGVNPVDTMFRSGTFSGGQQLSNVVILGSESSGIVEKLYEPVPGLSVGDKVIVKSGRGGYADYIATSSKNIYKIPEGMSMKEAAAFSATALTAYWGLYGFYKIKDGETIAVVGASGSVGSYLIQLLKPMNVNVIAVASGRNEAYVKSLGADIFIDYANEPMVQKYAKTADYVLDASLFNSGEKTALTLVKENGTYLGMSTLPDPSIRPDVKLLFLSRTPEMTTAIGMEKLTEFYEKYGLVINIAYMFPLTVEGVKKAHELITESRKSGKILLSNKMEEER